MTERNTSSVPRRTYHSPLRQAQAEATRTRILDAALDLFDELGYPGTSIARIARAAGVSPETVYGAFGTKRAIVDGLLERVDEERSPDRARRLVEERGGTPRVVLEVLTEVSTGFWERNARLVRLLREGHGDPDIGDEWVRRQHLRLQLVKGVMATWPKRVLRNRLTPDRAAEIAWALTSDELHRMLVTVLGWPMESYVAYVKELVRREVLADPEAP